MQAPASASAQGQQQSNDQGGTSEAVSHQQEAAEQAGTLSGVQNLKTKGGGEERAVPLSSMGPSYGNLSQEVRVYTASDISCLQATFVCSCCCNSC